jgi:NAD(P)H-hydrate epimerase
MAERLYNLPPLPARPVRSHKGTFGRVLVVGGEMMGAPILAGTAALRSGSGLVQVAMDEKFLAAGLSITPELVGLGLRGSSVAALLVAAKLAEAMVVGPGMGLSAGAVSRVGKLLKMPCAMVVDADAINVLAKRIAMFPKKAGKIVLTPHPGEMGRLCAALKLGKVPADDLGRQAIATAAAKRLGCVVLLKGYHTVITDGARMCVNKTGDSSLAKAGTGDVLAGVIGSLMGQGVAAFEAAAMGAWIHGTAGELAGRAMGPRHVLARDVIGHLAGAFAAYEKRFGVCNDVERP